LELGFPEFLPELSLIPNMSPFLLERNVSVLIGEGVVLLLSLFEDLSALRHLIPVSIVSRHGNPCSLLVSDMATRKDTVDEACWME